MNEKKVKGLRRLLQEHLSGYDLSEPRVMPCQIAENLATMKQDKDKDKLGIAEQMP